MSSFKKPLNKLLAKENGYKFGDPIHTISYAVGKNKIKGTLTPMGKTFDKQLDFIEPFHSLIIVKHEEHRCGCNQPYKETF